MYINLKLTYYLFNIFHPVTYGGDMIVFVSESTRLVDVLVFLVLRDH